MAERNYAEITPYLKKMARISGERNGIRSSMYADYDVKRGLRDVNGNGVRAGLTEISNIVAKAIDADGNEIPCEGRLYYRGIDVRDIVQGFLAENRHGFEETVYLLLFSELPKKRDLDKFVSVLSEYRALPPSFVRDMILKAPGKNMMNILSRSVLGLYAYDDNADGISTENILRQCLQLIAQFPLLAVYGYQSFRHYHNGKSLFIHFPKPELDTAENLLYILREDGQYSALEAKTLDLALVLHAEHGGGNNSTFTTHVVTSSGTDTYSAMSAALGSLKGPRHGGANVKVVQMFDDMKAAIDVHNRRALEDYLARLLDKQAFDRMGLIYGMGHAVYSKSDPRADILHDAARSLAVEKGMEEEFALYETVAELAPRIIAEKRKIYKGVSANVDFYSGLLYRMLGLPEELFTPIFAISRIAGWSAHRMEEIQCSGKIIRPTYVSVKPVAPYVPMDHRK